jgi:hypothetical protein
MNNMTHVKLQISEFGAEKSYINNLCFKCFRGFSHEYLFGDSSRPYAVLIQLSVDIAHGQFLID